ncbi:unnamed protein product, partial [Phaeothamnion confervicola]
APFADAALQTLAARVLLTYVSHAALLRPLAEAGKLRITRDMAAIEVALSQVKSPPALGTAYDELRAFRQLRSLLTEPCMVGLRPSSVWHYLFSQAPHELSSPHVAACKSELEYVEWLLGGGAAAEWNESGGGSANGGGRNTIGIGFATATSGGGNLRLTRTLAADTSHAAEAAAWAVVQRCLDGYHQRRSAAASGKGAPTSSVVLLAEAGPVLLAGYQERMA